MAQTAYTGLPGSGKSYGVVKHVILPALEKGRRVWTNVPLKLDLLEEKYPSLITLFDTKDLIDDQAWFQNIFAAGATIVIDEAWRLWPQGIKANNMIEGHKSFLAEHRHMVGSDGMSTEIVLVTQDLSQIAAYPRNLTEFTYRAEKLTSVGQSNRYRIDIFRGAVSGTNPPERLRTRQIFGKYEPEVYQYYKSQTMSEVDTHGSESQTDSRTNILNSNFFRMGLPALLVIGGLFVWYSMAQLSDMYGTEDQEEELAQVESEITAVPENVKPVVNIKEVLEVKKHVEHFYSGKNAHIAWNNGVFPWIEFKIAFEDDETSLVMSPDQLGKLGYSFIAHDSCFGQLIGHGDTLNIFCQSPEVANNTNSEVFDL
jgi:zona occludens toxin